MHRKGAFRVDRAYYKMYDDLIVFTGTIIQGPVEAGMWIDMPKALRGPGRVPIRSIETVQFNDREAVAVVVEYHHFAKAPLFEFSSVEGRTLEAVG